MFEQLFKAEMKRLNLRRYDVCKILDCTMPTLKARLQNPKNFTLGEIMILQENDFQLPKISENLSI